MIPKKALVVNAVVFLFILLHHASRPVDSFALGILVASKSRSRQGLLLSRQSQPLSALLQDSESSSQEGGGVGCTNVAVASAPREETCILSADTDVIQDLLLLSNETQPETSFQKWRKIIPVQLQCFLRDSGWLRLLIDSILFPLAIPSILKTYPTALQDFWTISGGGWLSLLLTATRPLLSKHGNKNPPITSKVEFRQLRYGNHSRNVIDFIWPSSLQTSNSNSHNRTFTFTTSDDDAQCPPLIVFVHGGAWGSGFPSMYRLVATPFVTQAQMSVAIVGYRTYPDADVPGQMDDLVRALQRLSVHFPSSVPTFLVGHSSGAHLLSLALLSSTKNLRQQILGENNNLNLVGFIGMAGVYDIPNHYEYEAKRGVELVSPMSVACGGTHAAWERYSPTRILLDRRRRRHHLLLSPPQPPPTLVGGNEDDEKRLPNTYSYFGPCGLSTLICHGTEDTTVPMSSSISYVDAWNKALVGTSSLYSLSSSSPSASSSVSTCQLRLLEGVGHSEMVLQLMFGGQTRDLVLNWIHLQLLEKNFASVVESKQSTVHEE
ncbi:hypothetical protein ACA910_004024 [Epithemia clementina (nom. ined.)]